MDLVASQHVGSSRIRDRTRAPVLAGGFFTTEPPGKPHAFLLSCFSAAWYPGLLPEPEVTLSGISSTHSYQNQTYSVSNSFRVNANSAL